MTTITITIDGNEVVGYSDATETTPELERKAIAIIMAAMDQVADALGGGASFDEVKRLIAPTIDRRKSEAGLPI